MNGARTYPLAVTIVAELERARQLAFADDELAAREILVALVPQIEAADRDDHMLEVFAQLGEIYVVRGVVDGATECIGRIRDCIAVYDAILAGTRPDLAAQVTLPLADVVVMVARYRMRAQFVETALLALRSDHENATAGLAALMAADVHEGLAAEHDYCVTVATGICATAMCDDDLYVRAAPLWEAAVARVEGLRRADPSADRLRVVTALGYGRFCVETGRLTVAEPWLRRANALALKHDWQLAAARATLETAALRWSAGDHESTESLVSGAYPTIAHHARAHDVSRCWLYFGLTRMGAGALAAADECFDNAERHWRELGKPIHIHRILLQRSWIQIFAGRFAEAVELVAKARDLLDVAPGAGWLQYARLDDHLGNIWRADALTDLGFDGAGDPEATLAEVEQRHARSLGVTTAQTGTPAFARAMVKLEQAADLKLPAALAVDSVRYTLTDAEARHRWASSVSSPMLAGAFAVAWEWENTQLVSELIEYHSARGALEDDGASESERSADDTAPWTRIATAPTPADDVAELAAVAGGAAVDKRPALRRLGPLPPLRMDPVGDEILQRYRTLAAQRYGRRVTSDEKPWATWP